MHIRKEPGKIHLVLEIGEDIISSLETVALQEGLPSASFTGIGGVGDITLGYFKLDNKIYAKQHYPGAWELVSLVGSISWDQDKPIVHAHASISDADYTVRAGHLFAAKVLVTAEIFLQLNQERLERAVDPNLKLKLLRF